MERPSQFAVLDFETYFDRDYTLRKMSTTEYVRDKRFKAQCVGIRLNRWRKAKWFDGEDAIRKAIESINWSKTALVCHHTQFDGLILHHHYGVVPAYYYCTLSMARALFSHDIGVGLDEVAKYLGYKGKEKADALAATKGIRNLPRELLEPLGLYCADDVDDTFNIFKDMLKGYPSDELDLIHLTVNAYANPVLHVDRALAQKELDKERAAKERIFRSAARNIQYNDPELIKKLLKKPEHKGKRAKDLTTRDKVEAALRNDDMLASAFKKLGVEPPQKYSEKQAKMVWAFAKGDLEFQALGNHPKKTVRNLYEARLNAKSTIGETRAARLLLHSETGNLPIYLNYAKAHTLRWSGGDKMNPQNFEASRGDPEKGVLRRCITAPPGYVLVVVDSGQIEARVTAWLAKQDDLLDIFRSGGDPYALFAARIYGKPVEKITKMERFVGKIAVLGLGYGMGSTKYQYTLESGAMGPSLIISEDEAKLIVNLYRRTNNRIKALWSAMANKLRIMQGNAATSNPFVKEPNRLDDILTFITGGVILPNGLMLHYEDITYEDEGGFTYWGGKYHKRIYGGLLTENIVQCLSRIIVAEQMLMIAERYRVVMMTHDETVYLARVEEAKEAYEFGVKCMTTAPAWCSDLPLAAEGGWDICYSK